MSKERKRGKEREEGSHSSSGVHLEKSNTNATRRRESSLNYIKEINNDESKKDVEVSFKSKTNTNTSTNQPQRPVTNTNTSAPVRPKSPQIKMDLPDQIKAAKPKGKWQTEDFTWTEERTSTSIIRKVKGLFTLLILGSAVAGVVLLYRSYLNGNSLQVASNLFSLFGGGQAIDSEAPVKEHKKTRLERGLSAATPTQTPAKSGASECSLLVESDPSGAIVVIEGREKGLTPLTHFVECKKSMDVIIKKEGFEVVSENIVAREKTSRFFRALKKIRFRKSPVYSRSKCNHRN
jgi:hypothetical protein